MISAQHAISRTQRDLTIGAVVRWGIFTAAAGALLVQPWLVRNGMTLATVLAVLGAGWLILSFNSVRGTRLAADSGSLIAAGQFDRAEARLDEALHAFSIFRTGKLICLHHLAALRHAQRRWPESAALSRAVVRQRPAPPRELERASRLILAEALLETGDLPGASEQLTRLTRLKLNLHEATQLLAVQLDCLARVNAWPALFASPLARVQIAELLTDVRVSARTQALLALAALKVGRADWAHWLRRRVELMIDPQLLCADRPMLCELWPNAGV